MFFKILIFDLDNTLIDRDRAFHEWLQQLHVETFGHTPDETKLASAILKDNSGKSDREVFWTSLIKDWGLSLSAEELQEKVNQELYRFINPDYKINNLLAELAQQRLLYLVSDGSSGNQRRKLKAAGLENCFKRIFISSEEKLWKPDLFFSVKDSLHVPAQDCLMIGDNYERDILGAAAVGIKTCYIGEKIADYNITSILELPDVLKETADCG